MFDLTIGTNLNRKKVPASYDKTPKQMLDEAGIDYSKGAVHLDGVTLDNNKMNTKFSELIKEATSASLVVTVKADAA